MDRRRGLAPLLVALLAISGGHAVPVRSAGPLCPDVSIAWNRSECRHTERELPRPAPLSHPDAVTVVERAHEDALSSSLLLWSFQRPPPAPSRTF